MGETDLWHPGHADELPKRGVGNTNDCWVGGAVLGGGSYRLELVWYVAVAVFEDECADTWEEGADLGIWIGYVRTTVFSGGAHYAT